MNYIIKIFLLVLVFITGFCAIITALIYALSTLDTMAEESLCSSSEAKTIGAIMIDNNCKIPIGGLYFEYNEESKRTKLLWESKNNLNVEVKK